MENKNQNRTSVEAAQKTGFGSNSQSQTNVRAPQGSQTSGSQTASTTQYDQSQKQQGISGSQKSAINSSSADQDLDEDDSFQSSTKDSRKI